MRSVHSSHVKDNQMGFTEVCLSLAESLVRRISRSLAVSSKEFVAQCLEIPPYSARSERIRKFSCDFVVCRCYATITHAIA